MLVVRIGRQVEPFVMSSIVVTEPSSLRRVHVLIDIEETLDRGFHIHELTQMEYGTVHKGDLTADKPFVRAPFIIGQTVGLYDGTGVNKLAELLKVCFNLQIG